MKPPVMVMKAHRCLVWGPLVTGCIVALAPHFEWDQCLEIIEKIMYSRYTVQSKKQKEKQHKGPNKKHDRE